MTDGCLCGSAYTAELGSSAQQMTKSGNSIAAASSSDESSWSTDARAPRCLARPAPAARKEIEEIIQEYQELMDGLYELLLRHLHCCRLAIASAFVHFFSTPDQDGSCIEALMCCMQVTLTNE